MRMRYDISLRKLSMYAIRCLLASMVFMLIPVPAISTNANMIQCPGTQQIEPLVSQYINHIRPVPFLKCYYIANAIDSININHCDDLYIAISQHLTGIQISDWACHFFPENAEYNYTFTFAASYST